MNNFRSPKTTPVLFLLIAAIIINMFIFGIWVLSKDHNRRIELSEKVFSEVDSEVDSIEHTITVDIIGGSTDIKTEEKENRKRITSVPSGKDTKINVDVRFKIGGMLFVEPVQLTPSEILSFYIKAEFPMRTKVMYNASRGVLKGYLGTRYLGEVKMDKKDAINIIANIRKESKGGVSGGAVVGGT